MPQNTEPSVEAKGEDVAGPRAILRVPEVLMAIASSRGGSSLAALWTQLKVPKPSLHRILRTLERGGYLTHQAGLYRLGPASFHLGSLIGQAAPSTDFPGCARPVIEWLARETQETVMLGLFLEPNMEILYVDVIDSVSPVRFTVPIGDRRPLFSAASGKAVLAFLPPNMRQAYLDHAEFAAFTPFTSGKDELPEVLREVREKALAFDIGGKVAGAGALATPFWDRLGKVLGSVSVAGPAERINANRERLEPLVRTAGERISRALGHSGDYPPSD